MLFQIEVHEDGDIIVTKVEKKPLYHTLMCVDTYEQLRMELDDYGAQEIEEDLKMVEKAAVGEEVRCY